MIRSATIQYNQTKIPLLVTNFCSTRLRCRSFAVIGATYTTIPSLSIRLSSKYTSMKKIAIFLLLIAVIASQSFAQNQRLKFNFNSDWKVKVGDTTGAEKRDFNDAAWRAVTLPYAWNEDDAFKVSIDELRTGIAWYRKHFKIDASQKGQKVFLEFEGIRQGGEFFLNGKSIGLSENGIMAFGFDITDVVKFDEDNIISARIDNAWNYHEKATNSTFQWNDKNFYANYGGINKNVYLHITNPVYQTFPLFSNLGTTGVYVYADNFNIAQKSATVHVVSQIKNESQQPQNIAYEVNILDMSGKLIKTTKGNVVSINKGETNIAEITTNINGLEFWSWGYGYLYTVQSILKINDKIVDIVNTKTGFRKTEFKNGTVYLNDRAMQVHGYAQRTTNEWPAIGNAVPAWLSDYSNHLMVQGNANFVRWMHVTPWKQDIESCDRVGLMQAMPAGDSEGDVDGRRWDQRTEVMRDAIIYNRNNPSIIFYESGNKGVREAHMLAMKKVRDTYDSHGGRASGSREMLASTTAEYGGEMLYINKSATKPVWQMEYSRDEGLRKYWDAYTPPYHKDGAGPLHNGQDASSYNRNQDSHAIENIVRWYEYWHERPGTGTRVNGGGVNIIFSESNTHHRGAENYRRSGEVDAMRIIKDNFYANQIMWDGWVDIEHPGIHIIGHWNYEKGVKKDIYVISSADKVELKINGKSVGFGQQSNRFLYTFKNIDWQPGTIVATGFDKNNKSICSNQIVTAGEPFAINLKAITNPKGLIANGQDLALIEFDVVDAKGNRCPTALNTIHFNISGNGIWRGGIAQGPDNFILSKEIPVECGVNRAFIRTTTVAGNIKIQASAQGLQDGNLGLTSLPFKTENGLSNIMPNDGLVSNLAKGPTPATPSFIVSRKALVISKVKAGANSDSAYKSYDDNESTDWVNDGNAATAWIEYELDKQGTIGEVALKLNNFRTRAYPLKISVDGKVVFNQTTTSNLGYFTAVFTPIKGTKVKIELAGRGNVKQDSSVEVNGKKLDDGVARNDSNVGGRLSIIEAEIYEKL